MASPAQVKGSWQAPGRGGTILAPPTLGLGHWLNLGLLSLGAGLAFLSQAGKTTFQLFPDSVTWPEKQMESQGFSLPPSRHYCKCFLLLSEKLRMCPSSYQVLDSRGWGPCPKRRDMPHGLCPCHSFYFKCFSFHLCQVKCPSSFGFAVWGYFDGLVA